MFNGVHVEQGIAIHEGFTGKEDDIWRFLELGVSKTAIAKLTGVSPDDPLQLHEDPRAHAEPLACISARIVSVP